jgi:hypothetical protein
LVTGVVLIVLTDARTGYTSPAEFLDSVVKVLPGEGELGLGGIYQTLGLESGEPSVVNRGFRLELDEKIAKFPELNLDLDLVVLQGNERNGKTRVLGEPKRKRNKDAVARKLEAVASRELLNGVGKIKILNVSNHLGIAGLLARLDTELRPNGQKLGINLVDLHSTNVNNCRPDKGMTNFAGPDSRDILADGR